MQQDEVIREALTNARPSGTPLDPPPQPGEKVVRSTDLGAVDAEAVTAWVTKAGGRTQTASDADGLIWVIAESELDL